MADVIPQTAHRSAAGDNDGKTVDNSTIIFDKYIFINYLNDTEKYFCAPGDLSAAKGQVFCPKPRDKPMHSGISVTRAIAIRPERTAGPRSAPLTPFRPPEQTADMHRFPMPLVLASTSPIRLQLLRAAGLTVETHAPRVDEDTIRTALLADGASPRDIADTLAEMKARKVSDRRPGDLVLGCDQVLELDGETFAKPASPDQARDQLRKLRGQTHRLQSAIVAYENARPVWRHVAEARLTMHPLSDAYLDDYVTRNWDSIRHSVGCYKIEEEGVRLFSAISGDHFTILGMPLLPLLAWLGVKGMIAG